MPAYAHLVYAGNSEIRDMMQDDREVIILVGMQGAGKTFYCQTVLSKYERISQDEGPRTYRGVVLRLGELLREGAPRIVIDRTNPMRHQRRQFGRRRQVTDHVIKGR